MLYTEGALVAVTTGSSAFERCHHGGASAPSCLPSSRTVASACPVASLSHCAWLPVTRRPAPRGSPMLLGQALPVQPPGSPVPSWPRAPRTVPQMPHRPEVAWLPCAHLRSDFEAPDFEGRHCQGGNPHTWEKLAIMPRRGKGHVRCPGKTAAASPHSTANWRLGSIPSTKQWGLLCFSQKS